MTQEEKQLLLKDLCSRLPYGVICKLSCKLYAKGANISITEKLDTGGLEHFIFGTMEVLPYLRPMSSMTEEERREYDKLIAKCIYDPEAYFFDNYDRLYDWLNAHHFDYRGLIPMGLAIEAPVDMYKME